MDGTVRRIGVLAPMPSELAPVVKTMKLTRQPADDPAVHVGTVGTVDVVAMRTGMGLTLASGATSDLLDHFEIDHVLVVGIAGGIGDTRVGDVLRPAAAVDRSSGTRYDATPLTGEVDGVVSSSDEFLVDPERVAALVDDGVRAARHGDLRGRRRVHGARGDLERGAGDQRPVLRPPRRVGARSGQPRRHAERCAPRSRSCCATPAGSPA